MNITLLGSRRQFGPSHGLKKLLNKIGESMNSAMKDMEVKPPATVGGIVGVTVALVFCAAVVTLASIVLLSTLMVL